MTTTTTTEAIESGHVLPPITPITAFLKSSLNATPSRAEPSRAKTGRSIRWLVDVRKNSENDRNSRQTERLARLECHLNYYCHATAKLQFVSENRKYRRRLRIVVVVFVFVRRGVRETAFLHL